MENDEVALAEGFDHKAAKALGKLVQKVLDDPDRWEEFRADPIGTAEKEGVEITEKTRKIIDTLGEMSDDELRGFKKLNSLLIDEDVYVETGNPPLMVY
jgi:hypothetical protein